MANGKDKGWTLCLDPDVIERVTLVVSATLAECGTVLAALAKEESTGGDAINKLHMRPVDEAIDKPVEAIKTALTKQAEKLVTHCKDLQQKMKDLVVAVEAYESTQVTQSGIAETTVAKVAKPSP